MRLQYDPGYCGRLRNCLPKRPRGMSCFVSNQGPVRAQDLSNPSPRFIWRPRSNQKAGLWRIVQSDSGAGTFAARGVFGDL